MEKRRCHAEFSGDSCEKSLRTNADVTAGTVAQGHLELEKRARREIANNNERRRMQSINAGFDSLRILLPPTQDGEKMSKATILQLTAKYINTLLLRVSILENEVATYRQSAGIQPATLLPDLPGTVTVTKKRKIEDSKKRTDSNRRRRRADVDPLFDTPIRNTYISCSSDSTDHHQPSPLTSFNGSISVSPTSPQPESTSSTAARLEHLVMAIEQIEGGGTLNVSPQPESHDGSFSAGDQSPPLPPETYWQSPRENYHGYSYSDPPSSMNKGTIHSFPDVLMLTSVAEINSQNPVHVTPINGGHIQSSSGDYPIVAKLLNRPIPHKYLHRPQVVVNSSH